MNDYTGGLWAEFASLGVLAFKIDEDIHKGPANLGEAAAVCETPPPSATSRYRTVKGDGSGAGAVAVRLAPWVRLLSLASCSDCLPDVQLKLP